MRKIFRNNDITLRIKPKWLIPSSVVVFIILRFYALQSPDLNNTVWKEIDYLEISRNYTLNHFKFWEPTISWPAEGPRVTAMEFPIIPYIAAIFYKIAGINVLTARMITLVFFIILSLYLYKLVFLQTQNRWLAYLAMVISFYLPLNFIFGRILFSEPAIVSLIVVSIYHMLKWTKTDSNKYFTYSFVIAGLCFLLKPTAMYVLVPLFYLYITKVKSFNILAYRRFAVGISLSIIPAFLWYYYVYRLTLNSIDVFGIFGGHDKFQTVAMLLSRNWWIKIIYRFIELFGGTHILIVCIIGVIAGIFKRENWLFHIILLSNVAFLFIVAEGNLDAPYRQFAFIASASYFISYGIKELYDIIYKGYSRLFSNQKLFPIIRKDIGFTLIVLLVIFVFTTGFIKTHPDKDYIGHPRVYDLANKVNQIKKDSSKLVVAGNYSAHKGGNDLSPVLYYYTNLQGWSLEKDNWNFEQIEKAKEKGADLFIGMNIFTPEASDFIRNVSNKYKVLMKTTNYTICDLKQLRE